MEISYPVFRVGIDRPIVEEGVILYIRKTEDGLKYKIVDDITLPEKTLALRRLKLLKQGIPLKRLSKAVFFLGDLVKLGTSSTWFIDSKGKIFTYKKVTSAKLISKKIIKVIPITTGGAILEVEGISSRFKCLFAPKPYQKYAGVLIYKLSYILYGLYSEPFSDTTRRI